jgi:peptide/nickel transport system permease protein
MASIKSTFCVLVLLVPTVLGVTLLVFLMMRFIPGDPVSLLLGDYYTEEAAAAIRQQYGLDRTLPMQYVLWLRQVVSGNWGSSIIAKRPIFADLVRRLPITLELIVLSMGFALLIASGDILPPYGPILATGDDRMVGVIGIFLLLFDLHFPWPGTSTGGWVYR